MVTSSSMDNPHGPAREFARTGSPADATVPSPRSSEGGSPAHAIEPGRLPLRPGGASRALVSDARRLQGQISGLLAEPSARRAAARRAFDAVRDATVRQQLHAMSFFNHTATTEGRLRLGMIERAGYRTVGAAAAAGRHRLE